MNPTWVDRTLRNDSTNFPYKLSRPSPSPHPSIIIHSPTHPHPHPPTPTHTHPPHRHPSSPTHPSPPHPQREISRELPKPGPLAPTHPAHPTPAVARRALPPRGMHDFGGPEFSTGVEVRGTRCIRCIRQIGWVNGSVMLINSNPSISHTLTHPRPYSTPYTLHPSLFTLHPSLFTLHSSLF
jgi:hypothetical protein